MCIYNFGVTEQINIYISLLLPGTSVAPSMGRSSSTSALLSSVSTSSSSLLLTSPPSPGCVAWSLLSCTTSFSCSLPGQQPRQSTCTSSWWRWWGWTSTSEAIRGRLVSQHGVSDFANNIIIIMALLRINLLLMAVVPAIIVLISLAGHKYYTSKY